METVCSVEGCGREVAVKKHGLCQAHYMRWWRHGDPEAWIKPVRQYCTVGGCDFKRVGRGLCQKHYSRLMRYGTTDKPERPTVCEVDNCGRPVDAQGMCDRHYRRTRKGLTGQRFCRMCGKALDPNLHAQRLFCSRECKERDAYFKRRETGRATWLKRYGLTVETFDAMLAEQGGRCAICRTDDFGRNRNWSVDHDHRTGRVRGLLCQTCNAGLGHFKDDPALLLAAIKYLAPVTVP